MREGSRRSTGLLSVYYYPLSAPSALSPLTVLPVVRSASHGRRLPMATTSSLPTTTHSALSFSPLPPYPFRPPPFLFLSLILPYPLQQPVFLLLILHLFSSPLSLAASCFFLFSLPPHFSPIIPALLFFSFPIILLLPSFLPHPNLLPTTPLSIEATALCTRALRARCN